MVYILFQSTIVKAKFWLFNLLNRISHNHSQIVINSLNGIIITVHRTDLNTHLIIPVVTIYTSYSPRFIFDVNGQKLSVTMTGKVIKGNCLFITDF